MLPSIEERLSALEAWARSQGMGAPPLEIAHPAVERPAPMPPEGFSQTAAEHARQQREGGR